MSGSRTQKPKLESNEIERFANKGIGFLIIITVTKLTKCKNIKYKRRRVFLESIKLKTQKHNQKRKQKIIRCILLKLSKFINDMYIYS